MNGHYSRRNTDIPTDTIRVFDAVYSGAHYMDFPAEHAPTYLRRMLENFRSATWITWFNSGILEPDLGPVSHTDGVSKAVWQLSLTAHSVGRQSCGESSRKSTPGQATISEKRNGSAMVPAL